MRDTTYKLKAFVKDPKFNPQHKLYSETDESIEVTRSTPDKKRMTKQMHILVYQINSGGFLKYFLD